MTDQRLRLLIIGAHPDDAEFYAGGLAATYRASGHTVKMVSVTDGAAGHQTRSAAELAQIRRAEALAAGQVIGAEYAIWSYPDGSLQPNLELRNRVIREIRGFVPDLVLTHRVYDYHPDHRAVGQAVQDASFLVRVPLVVPDAPALPKDPVVACMHDGFTRPAPLRGDVVIDIAKRMETIVRMLACHGSQVFEWLPWLDGVESQVPSAEAARMKWLRDRYAAYIRPRAEQFRRELIAAYGEARGRSVEYAEVFEISEYASPLDDAAKRRLFHFL